MGLRLLEIFLPYSAVDPSVVRVKNFKNYFHTNLKDHEVFKSRFTQKFIPVKVYYSVYRLALQELNNTTVCMLRK